MEIKAIYTTTTATTEITPETILDWYMNEYAAIIERGLFLQRVLCENGRLQRHRILTKEQARGKR